MNESLYDNKANYIIHQQYLPDFNKVNKNVLALIISLTYSIQLT